MSKGYEKIDGIRLKVRDVTERDGHVWAVATVWIQDKPVTELARIRLDHFAEVDVGLYHAWVDSISAIFSKTISEATGIEGVMSKRERPRRVGE